MVPCTTSISAPMSVETAEVHVELAAPDVVAPGHGDERLAAPCEKGSENVDRRPHLGDQIVGSFAVQIPASVDDDFVVARTLDRCTHRTQDVRHHVEVGDGRHVGRARPAGSHERRGHVLAPAVLGGARRPRTDPDRGSPGRTRRRSMRPERMRRAPPLYGGPDGTPTCAPALGARRAGACGHLLRPRGRRGADRRRAPRVLDFVLRCAGGAARRCFLRGGRRLWVATSSRMYAEAIRNVWSYVSPSQVLHARNAGAASTEPILAGLQTPRHHVTWSTSHALEVADGSGEHRGGRALFAAHAVLPWPMCCALLGVWHGCTCRRGTPWRRARGRTSHSGRGAV